jgi:hypothetical protein
MCSIVKAALAIIGQLQVDLVNQCRGLQRMSGTFSSQVPRRDAVQFAIKRCNQCVERCLVPRAESVKQFGQGWTHAIRVR